MPEDQSHGTGCDIKNIPLNPPVPYPYFMETIAWRGRLGDLGQLDRAGAATVEDVEHRARAAFGVVVCRRVILICYGEAEQDDVAALDKVLPVENRHERLRGLIHLGSPVPHLKSDISSGNLKLSPVLLPSQRSRRKTGGENRESGEKKAHYQNFCGSLEYVDHT